MTKTWDAVVVGGGFADHVWTEMLRYGLRVEPAIEAERVSSAELVWETNGAFVIAGGTRALVGKLREDLGSADVRQGSTVRAVARAEGVVRVITDDGEEHLGRTCILAVPVNALRHMTFTPDLSAGRRRAVDEGVLGRGVKFWARLRGELPHFYAMAPGDHLISIVESSSFVDGDALVVGFGPSARDLDIHDRAAVQEAVRELVPGAEVVQTGGHDWTNDPFSGMTWCAYGDIANGWGSYIDGAVESGITAGRDAMAFLAGG